MIYKIEVLQPGSRIATQALETNNLSLALIKIIGLLDDPCTVLITTQGEGEGK
jgi:hypothetical protein